MAIGKIDVSDVLTEGSKLASIDKTNDDDLSALTKSATIQSLIAMVLDLQTRVKALESKPASVLTSVIKP